MTTLPDLGLILVRDGVGQHVLHHFYDVAITQVSLLDDGTITTCLTTSYDGRGVAVSFDFQGGHAASCLPERQQSWARRSSLLPIERTKWEGPLPWLMRFKYTFRQDSAPSLSAPRTHLFR